MRLPKSMSPTFNDPEKLPVENQSEVLFEESPSISTPVPKSKVSSLAVSWAKKYYMTVNSPYQQEEDGRGISEEIVREENRAKIVDKLEDTLRVSCHLAWSKVENLLGQDIERHGIHPDLIQGSEIIRDTQKLYQRAIDAYAEEEPPNRLSVLLRKDITQIRRKYGAVDPLVLGFMAMQCHYVGEILLGSLTPNQSAIFVPYLKVIDDYLLIPFDSIHNFAGNHEANSPVLRAVQHLLAVTTPIARRVQERVSLQNLGYRSRSGELTNPMVRISSIRDVEIFQTYLCLCVLEGSIRPIQEELFPICVMLYPRLHVSWKLVQNMMLVLFWEMKDHLSAEDMMVFSPYLRTMMEMFSDEVFSN